MLDFIYIQKCQILNKFGTFFKAFKYEFKNLLFYQLIFYLYLSQNILQSAIYLIV